MGLTLIIAYPAIRIDIYLIIYAVITLGHF